MKALCALFLVLMAGTAFGQSNLPACQGSDASKWSNCFGSWTQSGHKYVGEWKDGKFSGQGTNTWDNGDNYVGDFKDGKRNGQGTASAANGDKYVGEWKDGKAHGQGITYSGNGSIKESGIYKDHVLITSQYIDPNSFTRIVRNNLLPPSESKLSGEANNQEIEKTQISGEWINTDKGCKLWNPIPEKGETVTWTGLCKNGFTSGYGTQQWYLNDKVGNKLVGLVKDGKFVDGQISIFYPNGEKYFGEWRKEKANGLGTYIFKNGNKYEGEFKDYKRHGKGVLTKPDGTRQEGIWSENKFVRAETFTLPLLPKEIKLEDDRQYLAEERRRLDAEKVQLEQDRKSRGSAFGEIILIPNPNKLPLCSERLGTRQSPLKCWGEERRDRWSYVGEMENYGVDGQGQPAGKYHGQGVMVFTDGSRQEGIWFNGQLLSKSKVNIPNFDTKTANNSERSDLQRDQQKLAEERRKLEEDKRQREQSKLNQRILLQVNNSQPSAEGDFTINIQTNADTASLRVNGEEQGGRADGKYSVKRVARAGQETRFEIIAKDVYGNTDSKTITVSRTVVESMVTYQQLNPDRIKRQPERDAVAVIIGISNYKSLPKAEFSKDDAQVFYDYAIRALGVKPGNIKLLMDEQADAEEIYTAFKTWLPARVKSTTDVYVFYSGHGLPTQDGSGLYWLPQRANRDLISKTGILLSEVNSDIHASKPKSVTIFMDACYSGQARGGETLVASARPIALKSQPTTFPSNFTVISASQADQISSSSPELQHGIFSYYLMRGMEGDADLNKDGKIILDEIQKYLSENVGRQARIMNRQQEPQVIGDGSRVLVGR